MLIPRFTGVDMQYLDEDGNDVSDAMVTPRPTPGARAPRTGMVSGIIGRIVAQNVKILKAVDHSKRS